MGKVGVRQHINYQRAQRRARVRPSVAVHRGAVHGHRYELSSSSYARVRAPVYARVVRQAVSRVTNVAVFGSR